MKSSAFVLIFSAALIMNFVVSCKPQDVVGNITVKNIKSSDKDAPKISFQTVGGPVNGDQGTTINYTVTDAKSAIKNVTAFYSPNPGTDPYVALGSVPAGASSFELCVPNKNHPNPTIKLVAKDEQDNIGFATLDGFAITVTGDTALPNSFTSNTTSLTNSNPVNLQFDVCQPTHCSASALHYPSPSRQMYVLKNTTGVQPLAGDVNWVSCPTALGAGIDHTFGADGAVTFHLWTKEVDLDYGGATLTGISTGSMTQTVEYDNTAPVDNTADVQFTAQVIEPQDDFTNSGNNISIGWTAFTDANMADHRIYTYTDASCTGLFANHGLTGSTLNSDSAIIDGLTEGQYWVKVEAIDGVGLSTTSACSTDSIYVDLTPPVDNGANLQFIPDDSTTGDAIGMTWTGFSDLNLVDHRIITYTDPTCTTQFLDHGLWSLATPTGTISGLSGTGNFYAKVTAYDGVGNATTSACSTDTISIDTDSPVDNGANLQFTDAVEPDGNNVAVTWVAFTDGNGIGDHRLLTYTDASCTGLFADHGFTGSGTNSDSAIIDGLTDGTYWGRVEAKDTLGNTTISACSTDSILVDTLPPVDNTANLQFLPFYTNVNNSTAMTWTAFTDATLTDYYVSTYTDASCTGLYASHDHIGSTATAWTYTGAYPDGTYYAKVTALDMFARETTSTCSFDYVVIDTTNPTDNTANVQFDAITPAGEPAVDYDGDGNDIAISWTAFTDTNLSDHQITTYTDAACTVGAVVHPLTGSTTNSNSTVVDGLADGQYWVKVTAIDAATNTTTSACSPDSIVVDTTVPTDTGSNLQFTDAIDGDGMDVAVTWTAFTDVNGIANHRLLTYTDASCTGLYADHGLTGSGTNSDSAIIDGLADGQYWARVEARDPIGNATLSSCSTDSVIVDSAAPVDNTANLQFVPTYTNINNQTAMTWTGFTDLTLTDHRITTYTNSICSLGETFHPNTGSSANAATLTGVLADGTYYGKITAIDGLMRETTSTCSFDYVVIDTLPPTDNVANVQFDAVTPAGEPAVDYDNDGMDIAISWVAFTDVNLLNHQITTYTDAGCTVGAVVHPLTGSTTNSNATVVDSLPDGQYWAKVTAIDAATNSTTSLCSPDSIVVDMTSPTDTGADLQFTATHDNDGLAVGVTWTPFADTNGIVDHIVRTYTNPLCTLGLTVHPNTGSGAASASLTLPENQYWATVEAFDPAGNSTVSACSTDFIYVDINPPVDNTANFQFVPVETNSINDIAANWTAFSDLTLTDHRIDLYTDASCTAVFDFGAVGADLTGQKGNTDTGILDGLAENRYWATVTAYDYFNRQTTSNCSTDTVVIDLTAPTINVASTLGQFDAVTPAGEPADDYDTDGDNIAVSWNAFSDNYTLYNHQITTYTDAGCTLGGVAHTPTGSASNSDAASVDGLVDGHYWYTVTAFDLAGNNTTSACSPDELIVDTIPPAEATPAGTNFTFTDTHDVDGNDLDVSWNAFTDLNGIMDYHVVTYTNALCTVGAAVHPRIGSNAVTDNTTVDGLADGIYYGSVVAYDNAGNTNQSACSTDTIIVDSTAPVDNGANLQFVLVNTNTTDNIAVSWTAFTDLSLTNHRLNLYTSSTCAGAADFDYGVPGPEYTGSTANSDNVILDNLADGQYWGTVTAVDYFQKETTSTCSVDNIIIDTTPPTDNTASGQFTAAVEPAVDYDTDGNDIGVSWTAFTDLYLNNHRIVTYTDASCTGMYADHGLTGNAGNTDSVIVDGLVDGHYWVKVTAYDIAGNLTVSDCSPDEMIVDTISPTDTGADLQFTNQYNNSGNDIAATWTPFTDINGIGNHQIRTYTDASCTGLYATHPLTNQGTATDAGTIDGLTDGQYWATVEGFDNAGNSTVSACSTDFITIDTVAPDETPLMVIGTVVTTQQLGLYNLSDCSDVAFVQITKGAGSPPAYNAGTWQPCDETGYTMTFTDLTEGLNSLQFWIKDAADNVQSAFIPHNTIYSPPIITVVGGPTISTDTASMTISLCEEAKIFKVLFNETGTQPVWNDVNWQPCSKAVGALSYGTLTPGNHTLKVFYMYEDNPGPDDADDSNNAISVLPQDVPVTYNPTINWEEKPAWNRPQMTFTLGSCSGCTHVLFNQGGQPAMGDAAWQTCTTATGGLTHFMSSTGSQSLNVWFKDDPTIVYPDFQQVTVNFDPPDAYIFGGAAVNTNSPALSIDDCTNINKIFIKLDDLTATAPTVADFNGGSGQNCTTALNALTTPSMGAVEGPHFYDVWVKFTDDYILDPWFTRINVTYTIDDSTPPPITIGQGADANTTITLTNGDGGGPPPTLLASNSRAWYTLSTCEPIAPVTLTGTLDAAAGSTTITGTGTLFTTELATGDFINISGEVLKVVSIASNTSLGLIAPHTVGATGVAFTQEFPNDKYSHMILTESAVAPSSTDPDWLVCSTGPSDFKTKSMSPDGVHNLYAWFKDAAGNVSTSITDSVNVATGPDTIPPPRPPVIVEGAPTLTTAPAKLTITSCFDVDQVFVEPSDYPSPYTEPGVSDPGWFNCTEGIGDITYPLDLAGSYTVSVWFKDAAGNINPLPRDVSFIFDPTQGVFPEPLAYWTMDTNHKRFAKMLDVKGDRHLRMWDQDNFTAPAGKIGQAIKGTGTNSVLITENTSVLKPTVGVTVSMWAYLTQGDATTKGLMGNVEIGVGGYGFRLDSGNLEFFASGQSVSVATSSYSTGWQHLVGTSDGRYINIYLNGVLKNTTDLGAPANLTYGCPVLFAVGGLVDCSINPVTTNLFNEKIDEVVVWGNYLTATEVQSHYIDSFNQFKVNQDAVPPVDVTVAGFTADYMQNAHMTLPDCSQHKFIYMNETTHPPLVDSPDWQLCNTITKGIIHPNLIQGAHELKIWAKDEYDNISAGYLKVDTTIESTYYIPPGVLYYNMDNTHLNISEVLDIFSKHHATNVGADANQVGIVNEGFLFTRAESDYVEQKYASSTQLKDALTISLWADLTNGDNVKQVLAGNHMSPTGHGYGIEIDDTANELRFIVQTGAGPREVGVATTSYTTGYHQIIGVYNGQIMDLYIDGALVDQTDFGSVEQITYSCLGSFTIGAGATCNNGPEAGTHFNNDIDEVIVWDTAIDAATALYVFEGQDSIPPAAVAVTPRDNQYTVGIPLVRLNIADCTDIGTVYVTLGATPPTAEIPGWQTCSTTGDNIVSPQLAAGANTVKTWFKDSAGNVSLTSTDIVITYTHDFTIPDPNSYWTLDDTNIDGTDVADVVAGKNGQSFNTPNINPSQVNEGLTFDGLTDYVEVPYDASFKPANTVTLSAWYKVAAYDAADHVIAGNQNAGGYALVLGNNTIEFRVDALSATQVASTPTAEFAAGSWHHVAGVWDDGTIRLFVDGVEQYNSVISPTGLIDYTNNNSFVIGGASTTTTGTQGSYFAGELDEIAFWNSALTDTVITEIYNRGAGRDQIWYDVIPPTIPVNLNILYYNSLVSRANLTITDCSGMDYVIVTKEVFPPDKNDENWQLCNTLTGGILSKPLNAGDNFGKLWTKDLFGNISTSFEYVPLVNQYSYPVSRPVAHWTFDDAHWNATTRVASDRISQINLQAGTLENVSPSPTCMWTQAYTDTSFPGTTGLPSVQFAGFNLNYTDVKFPTILSTKHPGNTKLKPADKLSVGAWVYLTGNETTVDKHIISNEMNGKGWSLRVEAVNPDDRGLRFTVHTTGGTLEPYLETKNYPTGWHFVVGTYDGQTASLYFDGIFVKSFSAPAPSTITYQSGVNTFIGSQASTGDIPTRGITFYDWDCPGVGSTTYTDISYFKGRIDEVIVWDQVLTKLEVSSLYHNGADILYDTDTTPPANPTLALENTRPNMFTNKAYFTVNSCADISGVLVNEGTQPDKQDARWEVCRVRLGSFGIENLTPGGHTITTWFKDLAGNVTPVSSDLVVDYVASSIPSANAVWPLDNTSNVSKHYRDVIDFGVHDLLQVNIDTPLNPTATGVAAKVNEGVNLAVKSADNGAYLSASSTKLLRPVNYFSIGGWFYLTQNDNGTKVLVDHHDVTSATVRSGYKLHLSTGNLIFTTEFDIEGTRTLSVGTNTYTTGWHHVIGLFTGWDMKLYIDGVQVATTAQFPERDFVRYDSGALTNLYFGAESNQAANPGSFFGNKVDELGVWGFDLTPTEVTNIKNAGDTNTHFYAALPTPTGVDNAYIYHYDNFGSRARMTILDCTDTPYILVNAQGAGAPTGDEADWRQCRTEPGAIISGTLTPTTQFVDVWAKNLDGVVSTVPGTKEIYPVTSDHALTMPITYVSYNVEHFDGVNKNKDFIINAVSTDVNSPTRTGNLDGDALLLDGVNQYSTLGQYRIFDLREGLTIGLWAEVTTTGSWSLVSRTSGDLDDTEIKVSGGYLRFTVHALAYYYDRSTDQQEVIFPTSKISAGKHFIVGSYDGRDLRLYVDGILVATNNTGDRNWSNNNLRRIEMNAIGGFNIGYGTAGYYSGEVDEFMVFDRVLDEREIAGWYDRYMRNLNAGDTTPPATTPNISVANSTFGTDWPVVVPNPYYKVDDCTDIAGVFINLDGAGAPRYDDPGWQVCDTVDGHLNSPDLPPGVHTVKFWFKDIYGNVTAGSQDIVVNYTVPATPDPIAYYSFDEDEILDHRAYDAANGNHAYLYGTQTSTGKVNEGVYLDGTRHYIEIEQNAFNKPTEEMSISFWVNVPSSGRNGKYVFSNRGDQPEGWFMRWTGSGATGEYVEFIINLDGIDYMLDIPQDQIGNGWTHFIYTFDGRKIKLYVDGVFKREVDTGAERSISYSGTNTSLIIGGDATNNEKVDDTTIFATTFDELAIWNKALDQTQVTDVYTNRANNNTKQYNPGLNVITPVDANITIFDPPPGNKPYGSRLRLTITDCTDTNMILVNSSITAPANNDPEWQPCNTLPGGILSAPMPSGSVTPRVWAKAFTGEISASYGTPTNAPVTMPSFLDDIPRPVIHWSLNSVASGYTVGTTLKDAIGENHAELNVATPPESTFTSGGVAAIEEGYDFNGIDEFIHIHPTSSTNPLYDISISAWVELNRGETIHRHIVGNHQNMAAAGGAGSGLRIYNGELQFYVTAWDGSNPQSYVVGLDTNIYNSGVHFVTGTYDGRDLKLYLDGVLVNTYFIQFFNASRYELYHDDHSSWTIGAESNGVQSDAPGTHFFGVIDDIRIWHTALNEQQVYYAYEYGSDYLPTNVSDGIPPTDPGIEVTNNKTITETPYAYFTMPTCIGANGVEINAVFVNVVGDPDPQKDDLGWQYCSADEGFIISKLLNLGTATVQIWFRDEEGDISPVPTTYDITYTPPQMMNPFAYYTFDPADRVDNFHYLDKAGSRHIRTYSGASPIVGSPVVHGVRFGPSGSPYFLHPGPVDRTYVTDFKMTKNYSYAFWYYPREALTADSTLMDQGQFQLVRTKTDSIRAYTGNTWRQSTSRIKAATWNWIGVTRNGPNLKIFINGFEDSLHVIPNTNLGGSNDTFTFGDTFGRYDELVFFDQELTDDQMLHLYWKGAKALNIDVYPKERIQAPVPDHYWNFDAASFTNPVLTDLTGNAHVTAINPISSTGHLDAMVGESFNFARFEDAVLTPAEDNKNYVGLHQYMESQQPYAISLTGNFTISAWVKVPTPTGHSSDKGGAILDMWGPLDSQQSFQFYQNRGSNGGYTAKFRNAPSTIGERTVTTSYDTLNTSVGWNHIAVKKSNSVFEIFVNGRLSGYNKTLDVFPIYTNVPATRFRIGDSSLYAFYDQPGTMNANAGDMTMTGVGTSFNTDFTTEQIGTVTITGGGTAVTGTGTFFSSVLSAGDRIVVNGEWGEVANVWNNTSLDLVNPHVAGTDASNDTYRIKKNGWIRVGGYNGERRQIVSIESDTELTIATTPTGGFVGATIEMNSLSTAYSVEEEWAFDGNLDELAIWYEDLTQEKIWDLYQRGLSGLPISTEPLVQLDQFGTTTNADTVNLTLSDCKNYTHVWVGFLASPDPLSGDAGWVTCDTARGAIQSQTLTFDALNTIKIWFKEDPPGTVSGYTTTVNVTHASGDTTPPTPPVVTQETGSPTTLSFARYTLSTCTDIAGVFVNHSTDPAPTASTSGWKTCNTINSGFLSPMLNDGANTISFYFKDAAGNVTTNTDKAITHNKPPIPTPTMHFTFDSSSTPNKSLHEIINRREAIAGNHANITTGGVGIINENVQFVTNGYFQGYNDTSYPTNDFTFAAWVNLNVPSNDSMLYGYWDETQANNGFAIRIDKNGRLCFDIQTVNSVGDWNTAPYKKVCSSGKIDFATDQYVAIIKSGANVNFYINNAPSGFQTVDTGNFWATTLPYRIGAQDQGGNVSPVSGTIDEMSIWHSAITTVEIEAAYAEGLRGNPIVKEMQAQAPPIPTYYYNFDNTHWEATTVDILDDVMGNMDMQADSSPTYAVSGVTGQIAEAFDFNNINNMYSAATSVNLGTQFVISAWINMVAENDQSTILNRWGVLDADREFRLYSAGRYLKFDYHTTATDTWGTVGYDTITSNQQIPLNTWTHVAVSRNGDDVRLYINGGLVAGKSMGTDPLVDNGTLSLRIGGENNTGVNWFDGKIDEVAIYKKPMEERQLRYLYDRGVAVTAIPTDTVVTVAHPSSTVGVTPANITIGDCQGYAKMIAQDSASGAPAPATLVNNCLETVGGHQSSGLPATGNTVDVYLGDGATTVHGTVYPVNIIYSP